MKKIFYFALFLLFESFHLHSSSYRDKTAEQLANEFKKEVEKNKDLITHCLNLLKQKISIIEKGALDQNEKNKRLDLLRNDIASLEAQQKKLEDDIKSKTATYESLTSTNNELVTKLSDSNKPIALFNTQKEKFSNQINKIHIQNKTLEQTLSKQNQSINNSQPNNASVVNQSISVNNASAQSQSNPVKQQEPVKTADQLYEEMKQKIDNHKEEYKKSDYTKLDQEFLKIKEEVDNSDLNARLPMKEALDKLEKYIDSTYPAIVSSQLPSANQIPVNNISVNNGSGQSQPVRQVSQKAMELFEKMKIEIDNAYNLNKSNTQEFEKNMQNILEDIQTKIDDSQGTDKDDLIGAQELFNNYLDSAYTSDKK